MMRVAIIAFIILLVVLVVAHEFGHFILAKKAGVRVFEFAVGMGPKLFSRNKPKQPKLTPEQQKLSGRELGDLVKKLQMDDPTNGTEVSLRALPLGGFVSIKGENPSEDGSADKDSLLSAPFWWKIAILLGGVTMNVIVAWILFTATFTVGVKPIQVLPDNMFSIQSRSYIMPSWSFLKEKGLVSGHAVAQPAKIFDVSENSIAEKLGIQAGDTILSINDVAITSENIQTELKKHIGSQIAVTFAAQGGENDAQETKTATAICPEDACFLGVALDTIVSVESKKIQFPLVQSMGAAASEIRQQTKLSFVALGSIFGSIGNENAGPVTEKLTGPVGAAKIAEIILSENGLLGFLLFAGMMSMALAVFNVLPIPALDGGRILGFVIQKIFGFKSEKYYLIEGRINTIFFVLLMALGVFLIWNDLGRFWGVGL